MYILNLVINSCLCCFKDMDRNYNNNPEVEHVYDRLYNKRSYLSPNYKSGGYPQTSERQNVPGPSPQISSDVVEVTHAGGGVGFVAVGRLVKSKKHQSNAVDTQDVYEDQLIGSRLKHRSLSEHHSIHSESLVTPMRSSQSVSEVCNHHTDMQIDSSGFTDGGVPYHSRSHADSLTLDSGANVGLLRYSNSTEHNLASSSVIEPMEDGLSQEGSKEKIHDKTRRPRNVDSHNKQPDGRNASKKGTHHLKFICCYVLVFGRKLKQ